MYTIPHLTSPFFFNHTATTDIYTLSLHDALPISAPGGDEQHHRDAAARARRVAGCRLPPTAVLCGHEGPPLLLAPLARRPHALRRPRRPRQHALVAPPPASMARGADGGQVPRPGRCWRRVLLVRQRVPLLRPHAACRRGR